MGELPETWKLGRSGLRQDAADDGRSSGFVKQRRVEQGGENSGSRRTGQGVLGLVEQVLERRAAVRVALFILMVRGILVVAAREEREAGKLFQLAMIARRRPQEGEQENRDGFQEPHTQ